METLLAQLAAIKKMIGQGELEQAIEQLVAIVEHDTAYSELAQVVRLNQADLYQTKAQILKATIAPEESRLAINQVTDNILQVVNRMERGKLTLLEAKPNDPDQELPTSVRWKYYVVGGIVALTLAVVAWKFFWNTPAPLACPNFGKAKGFKAMILPLKQTGDQKTAAEPEVDIMAELNKLLEKSGRNAVSNIKPNYTEGYPTPERALELANECGAQMIVYGRNNAGILNIEFKILDAGGVKMKGDTSFNHLLASNDAGKYTQNAESVARYLFMVICNRIGQPIASAELERMSPSPATIIVGGSATAGATAALFDTAVHMAIAENHLISGKNDLAAEEYRAVLDADPTNFKALRNLGIISYKKGDYAASSRTLEAAIPDPENAEPEILKIRIESYEKTGQTEKAEEDLAVLKKMSPKDKAWVEETQKNVDAIKIKVKKQRDVAEKSVKNKPKDIKARSGAATLNQNLGEHDRAIKLAAEANKKDPKNLEAVTVLIEANLSKGDTSAAKKIAQKAANDGLTTKQVIRILPKVAPLMLDKRQ